MASSIIIESRRYQFDAFSCNRRHSVLPSSRVSDNDTSPVHHARSKTRHNQSSRASFPVCIDRTDSRHNQSRRSSCYKRNTSSLHITRSEIRHYQSNRSSRNQRRSDNNHLPKSCSRQYQISPNHRSQRAYNSRSCSPPQDLFSKRHYLSRSHSSHRRPTIVHHNKSLSNTGIDFITLTDMVVILILAIRM
jgi:hypothetical protein